jgi:hypothetical protein
MRPRDFLSAAVVIGMILLAFAAGNVFSGLNAGNHTVTLVTTQTD